MKKDKKELAKLALAGLLLAATLPAAAQAEAAGNEGNLPCSGRLQWGWWRLRWSFNRQFVRLQWKGA